jgi:hypothetical protein
VHLRHAYLTAVASALNGNASPGNGVPRVPCRTAAHPSGHTSSGCGPCCRSGHEIISARERETTPFISLLGGALVPCPFAAGAAQQSERTTRVRFSEKEVGEMVS